MLFALAPAALLLVPTRELALQTSQVCRELGKFLNLEVMVTFGGMPLKDDIMRLYNTVHIIVATPGRILDLANKGVAKMQSCKILGMDEVNIGSLPACMRRICSSHGIGRACSHVYDLLLLAT